MGFTYYSTFYIHKNAETSLPPAYTWAIAVWNTENSIVYLYIFQEFTKLTFKSRTHSEYKILNKTLFYHNTFSCQPRSVLSKRIKINGLWLILFDSYTEYSLWYNTLKLHPVKYKLITLFTHFPDKSVTCTKVSLKLAKMWATPNTFSPSLTWGPRVTCSSVFWVFPFRGAIL